LEQTILEIAQIFFFLECLRENMFLEKQKDGISFFTIGFEKQEKTPAPPIRIYIFLKKKD